MKGTGFQSFDEVEKQVLTRSEKHPLDVKFMETCKGFLSQIENTHMRELCFQTKIAAVLKCTFSSSHTECQQICFFLSVHLLPSSLLFSTTAVFSGKHQPLTTWPTPNYTQTNWWSSWWTKWSIYKLNSLHCTTTNQIFFSEYKQLAHLILTIYFPLWSLTEIERVPRDTESEKPSHVTFQITKTREGLMCKYNMELFADETHQCGCEVCTVCLHRRGWVISFCRFNEDIFNEIKLA